MREQLQHVWIMNGGGGGGFGVSGEYDLCEMEEDAMTNNIGDDSSVTTAALPHDDLPDSGVVSTGTAALKSTIIKQNGNNKMMSIAHSYNYTGRCSCPVLMVNTTD